MKAAVWITKLAFFLAFLLIIIAEATRISFLNFLADYKLLADLSRILSNCSFVEVILLYYGALTISALFIFGINGLFQKATS